MSRVMLCQQHAPPCHWLTTTTTPMTTTTTINDCHDNYECCMVEMTQHEEEEARNMSTRDSGTIPTVSTPSAYALPTPVPHPYTYWPPPPASMTMTKGGNCTNDGDTPPHCLHHPPPLPYCPLPLMSSHCPSLSAISYHPPPPHHLLLCWPPYNPAPLLLRPPLS